jgi:hypothetical protein
MRPAHQQRRGEIGAGPGRSVEMGAHGLVLAGLHRPHGERQPGEAMAAVDEDQALGERHGLIDIAVGERCDEGAFEDFVVAGVLTQCGAPVDGSCRRVAHGRGKAGGQHIAIYRRAQGVAEGRRCAERLEGGVAALGGCSRRGGKSGSERDRPQKGVERHYRSLVIPRGGSAKGSAGMGPHGVRRPGAQAAGHPATMPANPVIRKATIAADLGDAVAGWRFPGANAAPGLMRLPARFSRSRRAARSARRSAPWPSRPPPPTT